ncbi:hypothetical protein SEA_LAKES_36 [Mycobacterium phage Lakes]|uniref:Uncharacterized protein n=6 Tax=root TaxID=1 RepID=O64227_BPMD2|nr:hypothetical protein PBI_D29_32.1 [Mycobacterium phage D29]YP_008058304.1 hypothetical protein M178_gp30 [Mycobacterium phage Chy5]YP_008060190.1 hypothetical protein M179_gp30 [Mycobacterium phage Chy4]AGK85797.1 hypothetical protein Chy1_0030 [Mycobacterium phage Chy1]AOQ27868.1 hypothetical protein SEA_POMAR16_36 [Mycobacterium phage Pomar16]APC43087.1 hypothetical protein SEA_KERBEROS_36 [Mycobacterium phage Kerberos]APC46154.1 hypothetical protein PBI_STARSTUFF_36 [Mycobacterium phage
MEYDYALRYEGQQTPDGPWVEVIVPAASLAEARAGYEASLPTMIDNPSIRNLQIVYTPKIQWTVWTE